MKLEYFLSSYPDVHYTKEILSDLFFSNKPPQIRCPPFQIELTQDTGGETPLSQEQKAIFTLDFKGRLQIQLPQPTSNKIWKKVYKFVAQAKAIYSGKLAYKWFEVTIDNNPCIFEKVKA